MLLCFLVAELKFHHAAHVFRISSLFFFGCQAGENINTTIAAVQPPASTETHSAPGSRAHMPWGQVKLLPMDGGSNRACRGITQGQTGFTSQGFFWGVAKQWGNDFSKPFVELQTKFVEDKDCVAPVQLVDHCCLLF